jgi:aminomethyltransferase
VDGDAVGEVTRAAWSPHREAAVAFALVPFDADASTVTVPVGDGVVTGRVSALPFVDSGERSARVPQYD